MHNNFNIYGFETNFGLFFEAFEEGIGCTRTEFGLAIGIQMLFGEYLLHYLVSC